MTASDVSYLCPVCGYPGLEEPVHDEVGCSSFGICPSCGTQFGYDDATSAHADLRKLWISKGLRWWSKAQPMPKDWDPVSQVQAINKGITRSESPDISGS
jgi:hypothetical protein